MRVIKEAKVRREEILDAARELFSQKGFDGTSTGDILDKVGIARGTLYYHFKSKEDIMDALIERLNQQILSTAVAIAEDKTIPFEKRIMNVILSLNVSGNQSEAVIDHIHNPQNALMHQKIQAKVVNEITPIMEALVQEGVEVGLFHTPYPYECMEMIMIYANTVFDGNTVVFTEEQRSKKEQAFVFHLERLLGAKEGSLRYVMEMFQNKEGGKYE